MIIKSFKLISFINDKDLTASIDSDRMLIISSIGHKKILLLSTLT
jgi:hypothetical protein